MGDKFIPFFDTKPMAKKKSLYSALSIAPADKIQPYSGVENNYRDFIPFGSDNLFPNALALFARQSPNHRGVINSKVNYAMGDGLVPTDENDQATEDLLQSINFEGESLNDVQKKLLLDNFITGNYYIECITDKNRSFLWFNHIDATKARVSKDLKNILIHPDWSRYTGKTDKNLKVIPVYPNFEPDTKDGISAHRCVYHGFSYEPEFSFYGIPQYISGKDSVQIDLRTNKWNLGRLKNSFRPGATMIVPVKDSAEAKLVSDTLKAQYTGEEKQGKTLLLTKSRALENEKADQTQYIPHTVEDKGSWIKLHQQSTSDIIVAHAWYRALSGIADNTGFDTERILNEYNIALSTVITSTQQEFVKLYNRLYSQTIGLDLAINFKNSPPLKAETYKYVWEIRKSRGESYDETDINQQEFIKT